MQPAFLRQIHAINAGDQLSKSELADKIMGETPAIYPY